MNRSLLQTSAPQTTAAPLGPASTFYVEVMTKLADANIPFLVGGGIAYARYSGVDRGIKDLDVFMRRDDVRRALAMFAAEGYETAMPFPHWLGKVKRGAHLVDLIFSSGNGVSRVDDLWFLYSTPAQVLGLTLRLCPPEETIWSKSFVQERERFDGADVLHILRALGPTLDWVRLLTRFDRYWRVLLSHIVLFGFVYPSQQECIPHWVKQELLLRMQEDEPDPMYHVCRGPLLSRSQYLHDIGPFGYSDARISPEGTMTREEVDIWTDAIDRVPPKD